MRVEYVAPDAIDRDEVGRREAVAREGLRFTHTFCSACGADIGPGNSGVSDCRDHSDGKRRAP